MHLKVALYTRQLELVGVGYKAALIKNPLTLFLKLGFSHSIRLKIPKNIKIYCPKETFILLKSSSKEALGLFISTVQKSKVPDIYKNKGILRCEQILNKRKLKKR